MYFAPAVNEDLIASHFDRNFAAIEPERMTKRNKLMRLLGGHDSRDDSGRKYWSFLGFYFVASDMRCDFIRKMHTRARMRCTIRSPLLADIDHRWPVLLVYVTQLTQCLPPDSVHLDLAQHMRLSHFGTSQLAVTIGALQPDLRQNVPQFLIVGAISE